MPKELHWLAQRKEGITVAAIKLQWLVEVFGPSQKNNEELAADFNPEAL
jgi:hypothetical protein